MLLIKCKYRHRFACTRSVRAYAAAAGAEDGVPYCFYNIVGPNNVHRVQVLYEFGVVWNCTQVNHHLTKNKKKSRHPVGDGRRYTGCIKYPHEHEHEREHEHEHAHAHAHAHEKKHQHSGACLR